MDDKVTAIYKWADYRGDHATDVQTIVHFPASMTVREVADWIRERSQKQQRQPVSVEFVIEETVPAALDPSPPESDAR